MCDQNEKFIFCTCGTEDELKQEEYTWRLTRFLGRKQTNIRGKILPPQTDLENGVNIKNISEQLNKSNPFDFEYEPQERDVITVSISSERNRYSYFSLIYKNEKWEPGKNPAFTSKLQQLAQGNLKPIQN